ncbi:hypothetical protein SCLCIDRAFT_1215128 [Scleroderma citrinum Foug A]|uniref:Uncharacterized protein n=1 Tax=Scleroderma citrinum Foug A TaxID=1036808 RepID=A0A0C3AC82_9AGAM|nr:hypothetical protein SCLCIDRAFT_1215128 [Scleroderma citrinum Foug A]
MAQNVAPNKTQFSTAKTKCRPGYERSRSIVTREFPSRMDAFKSDEGPCVYLLSSQNSASLSPNLVMGRTARTNNSCYGAMEHGN